MTVSALLMGFCWGLASSFDRDELSAANKEDEAIYGSLLVDYQSALMSCSFIALSLNCVALFAGTTTYVAFREVKPSTDLEATLFYKLFANEMGLMCAAMYSSTIFMCFAKPALSSFSALTYLFASCD